MLKTDLAILPYGVFRADFNMRLDTLLLRKGLPFPVLRLYAWKRPTYSVGVHQRVNREKYGLFEKLGIEFVRRPTGGLAVLHHIEVTYALISPKSHPIFGGSIWRSYEAVAGAIRHALRLLGVPAEISRNVPRKTKEELCFLTPSFGEILAKGKKIVGSAQARTATHILQHGAVLLDVDVPLWGRVFEIGEKMLKEKIGWVRRYYEGCTFQVLAEALLEGFHHVCGGKIFFTDWEDLM